ncbi:MAG: hypothetical protein ABIB71_00035 [Candidatus Woesearchaeota archaeon]
MRKTFMRQKEFFTIVNSHRLTAVYFLIVEEGFLRGSDVEDKTDMTHELCFPALLTLKRAGFLELKKKEKIKVYEYSTRPLADVLLYAYLTELFWIPFAARVHDWQDAMYSFRKAEADLEKLEGNGFLRRFIESVLTYDSVSMYCSEKTHQYCLACGNHNKYRKSRRCPKCEKQALIYTTMTLLEWGKMLLNHLSIIYGSGPLMKKLSAAERKDMEHLARIFDLGMRSPVYIAKDRLRAYMEEKEQ